MHQLLAAPQIKVANPLANASQASNIHDGHTPRECITDAWQALLSGRPLGSSKIADSPLDLANNALAKAVWDSPYQLGLISGLSLQLWQAQQAQMLMATQPREGPADEVRMQPCLHEHVTA